MAFSEEQKLKALNLYDELGSVSKVIHKLGYPTRQNMYTWIKNRNIDKKDKGNSLNNHSYKRYPSAETKLSIIKRCFEDGEDIKFVSEETGCSRTSIYN